MPSDIVVACALLSVALNLATLFVVWYSRRERSETMRFALTVIAASKAQTPQESVAVIEEMAPLADDKPTVDEKPLPEYITNTNGDRFKIGFDQNGVETLTDASGKVFEVLK